MEWREARARSCSLLEEALGGSCGLLRKARGEVSLVWGEARWAGECSLCYGPFYVPGCIVPLLVCVCDASFKIFTVRESGMGLARFLSINAALV